MLGVVFTTMKYEIAVLFFLLYHLPTLPDAKGQGQAYFHRESLAKSNTPKEAWQIISYPDTAHNFSCGKRETRYIDPEFSPDKPVVLENKIAAFVIYIQSCRPDENIIDT